jgi:ferredoxin
MALHITEECISCGACQPECPNEAIFPGGEDYDVNGETKSALSQETYYIAPEKCTECAGLDGGPRCASVCPTDACQKS